MAALFVLSVVSSAAAEEGPGDCLGVDFNTRNPVTIAKIIADRTRVYFVKNSSDDAACPAATASCQDQAYLVPGDLVLIGKGHGAFTCVSYQSAAARTQRWSNGWLPSAGMTPVVPAPAPSRSDWIGDWVHAGGKIVIRFGKRRALTVRGEAFYNAAQNVHTGVIDAVAKPVNGLLEFADDGSVPFDKASGNAECLVRMQRVEAFLVVEDNGGCGGVLVTFTGFYRRKR